MEVEVRYRNRRVRFLNRVLAPIFSHVRIHTDSQAAETAKSINARAFTVGPNIAFGHGQYAPESAAGKRLLAHELTHTIQQQSHIARVSRRSRDRCLCNEVLISRRRVRSRVRSRIPTLRLGQATQISGYVTCQTQLSATRTLLFSKVRAKHLAWFLRVGKRLRDFGKIF